MNRIQGERFVAVSHSNDSELTRHLRVTVFATVIIYPFFLEEFKREILQIKRIKGGFGFRNSLR